MKIILYRHKQPETGLDVSKGFSISFFEDDENEIAQLDFYPTENDNQPIQAAKERA